jgi:translation initiation factor eIF-2B subunit epsilon
LLTQEQCLLPLANTPLIEYTLEFLAMSGVSEIYVYCGAHTLEVENYLNASRWHPATSSGSPFFTLEILKSTARSVGDALRDIDNRGLITGDFLLVHGDLVSNLQIDGALSAHRARRIADKNAIMTLVLREGGLGPHRTKSHGITPIFVTDPTKNRCVHYEEMNPLQANKYVNIDPTLLSDHLEMEIRTDLIDCGIDICTPDVLALWSESFDYEVPRRHFLHGVLKDYELNGKTIHTEIITDHYAARASNLQEYEAISKDVLGRWTYPLVPDSNLVHGQSYKYSRGGICKEDGVILARSCKVGKKTVLGRETSIGDGSVVRNSIIGRRCHIGKNVTIENAYIWDGVVVGDGATVDRAIIASEAVIGQNCYIKPGALLSFSVRISDGMTVKEGARITRAKRKRIDVEGEPLSHMPPDPKVVGASGEGYSFHDSDESDDGDDATILQTSLIYSTSHLNLSNESISTLASDISAPSSTATPRSRLSSFVGSVSEDEDYGSSLGDGSGHSSGENFHKDAVADVYKTLSENGDFHNTRVEFTSLRLSNNATDHHVHRAIAVAFTKRIASLVESGLEASKAVAQTLDKPGAVAFLSDVAVGRDRKIEDQVDFLLCAQKDLTHRGKGEWILFALCKELYEREVLEEEGFEAWWGDARGSETAELVAVRGRTEVFMAWLRDAEEEDSDEEEESE